MNDAYEKIDKLLDGPCNAETMKEMDKAVREIDKVSTGSFWYGFFAGSIFGSLLVMIIYALSKVL